MASLFSRLRDRLRRDTGAHGLRLAGPSGVPAPVYQSEWAWVSSPDFSYDLSAYVYREWISTAIDRVAELCVSVPIEIRSTDGMTVNDGHPLLDMLGRYGRPNPFQDSIEFMESHFQRVDVFGNDVWYWSSAMGGAPDEVYQLDMQRLTLRHDGIRLVYEYRSGGEVYPLNPAAVTHFRRSNIVESGLFWGVSAIQKLRNVVESDRAMVRWNREFFETGVPSGILLVDADECSADDAKRIEKEFHAQSGDKRRLAVIRSKPGASAFQEANNRHRDLEFKDGRLLTRQAAFDALGFHVGAVSEASTEAHAKVAERLVRTSAYIRHMRSASRLNEVLNFWPGASRYQVRFQDVRTVDWELEAKKLSAVAPYMTINEVRSRYLDLPGISEGNELTQVSTSGQNVLSGAQGAREGGQGETEVDNGGASAGGRERAAAQNGA